MKYITTSLFTLFILATIAQSNNHEIPLSSSTQNMLFERSTKYPALSPQKYRSRQSSSRSQTISFYMDYGAVDSLYNIYGPNNGAGTFYRDDQYSFRLINTSMPVDSTDYNAYGFTWFPTIVDFVNNPDWPFNEYPPSDIQMTIDTVYVTLGHVHLSNKNDTITISIWDYDSFGEFVFDSGAGAGGTILLGEKKMIVDSSLLGGNGEGTQPGSFLLGTYPFSFAGSPVSVPQGHRFIIQVNFNGPFNDQFLLGSARRNDCASTCGASHPYVNATFGPVSNELDSFNSCYGIRYNAAGDSGVFPSPYFYTNCNGSGVKEGECEELYTQDFDIFPSIKASFSKFYVTATSNAQDVCPGTTVTLTGNGAGSSALPYTYSWQASNGSLSGFTGQQVTLTTSPNSVNNDTVILTLTDANQQAVKDTLIITSGGIAIKITNAVQPIELGCGQKAIITTSISGSILGKDYAWSTGQNGIAVSTITDSVAGTFTVTVTNSVGCSASANVTVDYNGTTNNVSFLQPTEGLWAGCPLTFINTSTHFLPPWQGVFNGDGAGDNNVPGNVQQIVYNYQNPGVYEATLTLDSGGCYFSVTEQVIVTPIPEGKTCLPSNEYSVSLGADRSVCYGDTITFNPIISNGSAPYSYSWGNTGNPLSCYLCSSPLATITESSTYSVTVTDSSHASASASVEISIDQFNAGSISFSLSAQQPVCIGEDVTLTATPQSTYGSFNFYWSTGQNAMEEYSSSTTIAPTTNTTYSVTVTDMNGCSAVADDNITVQPGAPVPVITGSASLPKCSPEADVLSVNNSYSSYLWSNYLTTPTITVTQAGNYTVTCTANSGCSAVSAPYDISVNSVPTVNICVVSVDETSGKNIIVWNNANNFVVGSYLIYKENYQSVFIPVGSVPSDSFSTYIDTSSDPLQNADSYYLAVLDVCGDTIPSSNTHQTIHLNINKGVGSAWNLIWNAYQGFYFPTYYIFRGTNSGNLQQIDSISSSNTSYTDVNPPSGLLYYQVSVVNPDGCSPSRSNDYSESFSNVANTASAGITNVQWQQFNMFPNPASTTLYFTSNFPAQWITIFDVNGRKVSEQKFAPQLDISALTDGVYFVEVKGENAIITKKVVKISGQ